MFLFDREMFVEYILHQKSNKAEVSTSTFFIRAHPIAFMKVDFVRKVDQKTKMYFLFFSNNVLSKFHAQTIPVLHQTSELYDFLMKHCIEDGSIVWVLLTYPAKTNKTPWKDDGKNFFLIFSICKWHVRPCHVDYNLGIKKKKKLVRWNKVSTQSVLSRIFFQLDIPSVSPQSPILFVIGSSEDIPWNCRLKEISTRYKWL